MWPAYAVDGKGHDDGDGKYTAQILVAGIGVHFYLGGEARFVRTPFGGDTRRMPTVSLGLLARTVSRVRSSAVLPVADIGVHFCLGGEGRGALRPAALWRQPEGCLSLGLRSRALEPRPHAHRHTHTNGIKDMPGRTAYNGGDGYVKRSSVCKVGSSRSYSTRIKVAQAVHSDYFLTVDYSLYRGYCGPPHRRGPAVHRPRRKSGKQSRKKRASFRPSRREAGSWAAPRRPPHRRGADRRVER